MERCKVLVLTLTHFFISLIASIREFFVVYTNLYLVL